MVASAPHESAGRLSRAAHPVGVPPWLAAASQPVSEFVLGTGALTALDFAGLFDSQADLRGELEACLPEAAITETCEVWRRTVRASGREVRALAASCREPQVAVSSAEPRGPGPLSIPKASCQEGAACVLQPSREKATASVREVPAAPFDLMRGRKRARAKPARQLTQRTQLADCRRLEGIFLAIKS